MTEDMDSMHGMDRTTLLLHRHTDGLPAQLPRPVDVRARAEGERRHRQGVIAGLAAAAAVVAVIVGVLAITPARNNSQQPISPTTPTETATETTVPANRSVNGRIQRTDEYLDRVGAACDGCYWPGTSFDQVTGTLLLVEFKPDNGSGIAGIKVVGSDGQVTSLACPDDFACPAGSWVVLGPGADEFSEMTDVDHLRVWGFDGRVRRVIDLSAALGEDEHAYVSAVAWSPDDDRLAVQTGGSGHARIWLFDRDGGYPPLLYTASSTEELPRLAISDLAWSPDGSRLGFVEEHWNMAAEFGRPRSEISGSTTAVSLLLPDAEQGGPGVATTLYEYTKDLHPPYDDDAPATFLWSPDGARVAVRFYDQLLELSAQDGTALAEHRFIEGLLIWPAASPEDHVASLPLP